MVLTNTSLRSSGCLFLSADAVMAGSDIILDLTIVFVLCKVFLGAPCLLCFTSLLSSYKSSVLIRLDLQIRALEKIAILITIVCVCVCV